MELPEKTEPIYRKLSWVLLIFCVCLGASSIGDYGMGWDEVTRWRSGDAKVDYYRTLLSSEDPMSVVRSAPNEAYPGFFDVTLSVIHQTLGGDRFVLGHWQAFLFGLVGLIGLWRIGALFGGARLGFWSVVLLVITPSFYGHWFHNPKDIPFAATYTLGLWALVEFFRRYPVLSKSWAFVAALACGACMATRIAGMVLLSYLFAGIVMLTLIFLWEKRERFEVKATVVALWRWWLSLPCIVLGAYLALLPWWPASHKNLLTVSGSTLQQLHDRASEIPLFFRGEFLLAADAPHSYALWMFGIKATEVLLLGLLLAVPFGLSFFRSKLATAGDFRGAPSLGVLLLGAFFPLFYLTCSGPALHNGARHFLFAFPALAVLAAWAYLQAGQWLREFRPQFLRIAQIAFVVLLLLPMWHLICLHPYQYVYYNALIGGPAGSYGHYETEYWFTSTKHGIEWLEEYIEEEGSTSKVTKILITGPHQVAERFLPESFELTSDRAQADYILANTQMMMHTLFEGEVVGSIQRGGLPILYIYKNKR